MYLAIDVGGTKTLAAVFDESGQITEQQKFPTNQKYELFLRELADIVAKFSTKDFSAVGIAIAGRLDRSQGKVLGMGNLPWPPVSIKKDLQELVHIPTFIENDAKLGALSEAVLIKNEFRKILYITIGTGIGVGLIIGDKIDNSIADGGGRTMFFEYKHKETAWDDFASGRAIVNQYGKQASEIEDPDIWREICQNITVGLIDLIALTAPEVVIIGGGVGSYFAKYHGFLEADLKKYETPMLHIPPLRQAKRPEEAVIYGCYELIRQQYGKANTTT